MPIKLAIVTPDKNVLDIECDEVVAPGVNGEIGILPGHINVITALQPGVLTIIKGSQKTYHAVSTGYAELEDDQVTVLTDACEASDEIDVDRAKAALSDAAKQLDGLGGEEPAFVEQNRRLLRARARLDTAALR